MADDGIGGLAYSGKIMSPVPFAGCVARVRDAIEAATGVYYDCCLINWYQDGECACKFHSDPDHGKVWARDTVVVSVGETRRFNLRAIPDSSVSTVLDKDQEQEHHSFHLYDGDVFYMFGDCQDAYQHAVLRSEGPTNTSPRASIVFKKSLPGPGGRRGHGVTKTAKVTSGQSLSTSQSTSQSQTQSRSQGHGHSQGQGQGQGHSQAPVRSTNSRPKGTHAPAPAAATASGQTREALGKRGAKAAGKKPTKSPGK